jgi:phosphofructokinase-like protein
MRIGIFTIGGDCAGLNAALRAATLRALGEYGWQVFGIRHGTLGLMERPIDAFELTAAHVDGSLLRQGGTFLGSTSKGDPSNFPNPDGTFSDHSHEIIEGIRQLKLDALIGIGGDGGHQIMTKLLKEIDLPYVAIPKTIDNDLGCTESAIGFTTAVDVATEALDRLQPTAASHDRVMILEVMGRDAGHIALSSGIAGGADIVLIPEIPYSIDGIAEKIGKLKQGNRNFALIVVSEAVKDEDGKSVKLKDINGKERYGGIGQYLSHKIERATGAETRFMVLGHVQRGGQPDSTDRIMASAFGVHAVDLVAQGKRDVMVAWQNRQVVSVPLSEAIKEYRGVSIKDTLLKTAMGLGIYIGDI